MLAFLSFEWVWGLGLFNGRVVRVIQSMGLYKDRVEGVVGGVGFVVELPDTATNIVGYRGRQSVV